MNIADKIKLLETRLGENRLKIGELLKYHTFAKSGGPAEYFYTVTTKKELIDILNLAHELKIPFFILGGGTKTKVSEKGMKGLIIKNRTVGTKIGGIKGKVGREGIGIEEANVTLDSGMTIQQLNDYLDSQKLRTINGISHKESTLGGSILLDPHLANVTQKVEVWNDGEVLEKEIIDLSANRDIVLAVTFKVKAKD